MRVGNDMVEIARLGRLYKNGTLPARIYTKNEMQHIMEGGSERRILERMSGKFASKEAFSKALGTGISNGIRWVDIEILSDINGMPIVFLYGKAHELFIKEFKEISLSIAHTEEYAMATCVLL